MLNKETLVTAAEGEPHVVLTVGYREKYGMLFTYGYMRDMEIGSISRKPCWGLAQLAYLYTLAADEGVYAYTNVCSATEKLTSSISVTRLDTGKTEVFTGEKGATPFFGADDVGKEIPLRFTPPYILRVARSSQYLPALERRAW